MSYKLYADDRCVEEIFSVNEIREKAGYKMMDSKEEKKICNCPNCGAPISSYICEYCGTEFEKPKKVLTDEEKRESFADFVREQKLRQIPYYQEWQTRNLLNGVNTQIMNMRDSINTSMALQNCSLRDQMYNASMLTNVYPTGRIEHIQIDKDGNIEDTPVSEADKELLTVLKWFMIGMVLFTLFAIVVTFIYNLH